MPSEAPGGGGRDLDRGGGVGPVGVSAFAVGVEGLSAVLDDIPRVVGDDVGGA